MPCYKPLKGWRSREVNSETGKRSIVFKADEGFSDLPVQVPCGKCVGCRIEHSRQFAIRCVHEASLYPDNCFVTLTYNDQCLPSGSNLVVSDLQKFFKRLRKRFGSGIRYLACGEYGVVCKICSKSFNFCVCGSFVPSAGRPHYHACIFNHTFSDLVYLYTTTAGSKMYRSAILESLWPYGFSTVGEVNFKSAGYVARYSWKKIDDERTSEYYSGRRSEFVVMSRGSKSLGTKGIGYGWYQRFKDDVYNHDVVVLDQGVSCRPPKYYDSQFELDNPEDYAKIKSKRSFKVRECANGNDVSKHPSRLPYREYVARRRITRLARRFEDEG